MPLTSALLVVVAAVCLAPASATAQDRTQSAAAAADIAPRVDPQLRADILHVLKVTHAVERAQSAIRARFELMRPRLLDALSATPDRVQIVADYGGRLSDLPKDPGFIDGMVAIYAKYFSDDDIKALAQFYDSPAGRHFNARTVDIERDSINLGQQLTEGKMKEVFAGVCNDYPELHRYAKFCPAPGQKETQVAADPK